jgi:hypothetical protein
MITNFKIFENIDEGEPEISDYVICDESDYSSDPKIKEYVKNHIGQFIEINGQYPRMSAYKYMIYYPDVDDSILNGNKREMSKEQIIRWSKNKEDLEQYIFAKKYNL